MLIFFAIGFGTILVIPISIIISFKIAIVLWSILIGIIYIIFSIRNLEMYGKLETAKSIYERALENSKKDVANIESRNILIKREKKAHKEYNTRLDTHEINIQSIHLIRVLTVTCGGILALYSLFPNTIDESPENIQTQTIQVDSFVHKIENLESNLLELKSLLKSQELKQKFNSLQTEIDSLKNKL